MSVTRVKVSEVSLPSSLATEYSMSAGTVIPGMSLGSAPSAPHPPRCGRVGDPRQPRAVLFQHPKHRQVHVQTSPAQHRHPGREHVGEQPVVQEVPVGQQQVAGLKLWQELAGHRLLPGRRRDIPATSAARVPHSPIPAAQDVREAAQGPLSLPG